MMGAVWARAGSELRRRWRAAAALAVLVGLLGGVAMAAAAGARRTASAYPRFLEASNAADILVNPDLGALTQLDFGAVEALPQVAAMGRAGGMVVLLAGDGNGPDFENAPLSLAPVDRRAFVTLERPKLLAGRLPHPDAAHELAVNRIVAERLDLAPGDVVTAYTASAEELFAGEEGGESPAFERLELTVTGIGVGADEVVVDEAFADDGRLLLTPAFYEAHQDAVFYWGLFVDLHPWADVASFRDDVERLAGAEAVEFQTASVTATKVQRAIRPQVVALAVFAALAGLAGLAVATQALARHLGADGADGPALRALGMTRRQRLAVALLRVALVGGAGAALAIVVAVALSPLAPVGPARLAEPDPGVAVDAAVLAAGSTGLVVLLLACAALPAWRATAVRSLRRSPHEVGGGPASRLAGALGRAGLGPPAVAGLKLALEPGRGRTAVPTRSTLVGSAVAVGSVVAAVTFATSLDHLLATPRLYGWNWDAQVEGGDAPEEEDIGLALAALASELEAHQAVAGFSVGNVGRVTLEGVPVPAVGIDARRGEVEPTLVAGRAPRADDEIALGRRTLERFGLAVGDTVTAQLHGSDATRSLRVVGQAVFPNFATYSGADNTELGAGALVTTASLARLGPQFTKSFLLVDLIDGADPAALLPPDDEGLLSLVDAPQLPADVVNFDRVRETPLALAGLLAALAVASVGHALVTSVRRRRRDLAMLKTLGFVRRQVSSLVAWQATTVAVVALAVGVPLGVAAGRWAWSLLAHGLGIPPEPVIPVLAVVAAVPAVVGLANLAAALPARRAGHVRPAVALRAE